MAALCHFTGAQANLPIDENPLFIGVLGDPGDRLEGFDPPPLHQLIRPQRGTSGAFVIQGLIPVIVAPPWAGAGMTTLRGAQCATA